MKKWFFVIGVVLLFFVFSFFPTTKKEMIQVEVKGAVLHPGVYSLEEGSRVFDVVSKSGGLLKNADISQTNLSKKVKDEMIVFIYTNEEISEMTKDGVIQYVERECNCPVVSSSSCFDEIITNTDSIISDTGKVSLNTGTLEELMSIPGIGESKAKEIIRYRESTPFGRIEDIMNIKGIGNATFEKIKAYLTL